MLASWEESKAFRPDEASTSTTWHSVVMLRRQTQSLLLMTSKPENIAFPSNSYMGRRDFLAFASMAEGKVLASCWCGTGLGGQVGT